MGAGKNQTNICGAHSAALFHFAGGKKTARGSVYSILARPRHFLLLSSCVSSKVSRKNAHRRYRFQKLTFMVRCSHPGAKKQART